jgi:hypothetical protein
VDVALCGLFVLVVVFLVKWEWGVVGDSVPQVVFCESKCAHVFFVVVECGAEVGFVPLNVFDRATHMWGGLKGFLHFFRHAFKLEPALGVVFPNGRSQHRRLCVRVERPCFHRRVKVFEVVKFLHLAPSSGSRSELGLGFAFVLEGLLCGVYELRHKEESRENKNVVDADGEV